MNIQKITNEFRKQTIVVIGDIMLDNYIFGEIKRISPEAPVPVVKYNKETAFPGGAANVALNLDSLGAKTFIIGTIGKDSSGKKILAQLKKSGINTKYILADPAKTTTVKTRIVSSNQQVLRIDHEETIDINPKIESQIIKSIKSTLKNLRPDAVILSDYRKGILTNKILSETINICNKSKIFIGVDPKGKDFSKYKGVNLITPNQSEAELSTNINIKDEASQIDCINKIVNQTKADCVLITKGKNGISYKEKKQKIKSIEAIQKDVFDVTGAGDTFISSFILTYLSTGSYDKSAEFANKAAAVSVTKFGASKITQAELIAVENKIDSKILTADELSKVIHKQKKSGKKVVFTNGCFDLFHHGHLSILEKSKKLGDILVVAINSDNSVKKLKGKQRPIVNEKNRSALLSSLEFVNYVVVFEENTPLKLIKKIKPDVITKGKDYSKDSVVGGKYIESYGGSVELIPLEKGFSTTGIVKKIKENTKN